LSFLAATATTKSHKLELNKPAKRIETPLFVEISEKENGYYHEKRKTAKHKEDNSVDGQLFKMLSGGRGIHFFFHLTKLFIFSRNSHRPRHKTFLPNLSFENNVVVNIHVLLLVYQL